MRIGGRTDRRDYGRDHKPSQDRRQKLPHRYRQRLFRVGQVAEIGAGEKAEIDRAGIDQDKPAERDQAGFLDRLNALCRHESRQHVRLARIAKPDSQQSDHEPQSRKAGSAGGKTQKAGVTFSEERFKRGVVGKFSECHDRHYDECYDHEAGLDDVGPADGPEAPGHGIGQDYCGAHENAPLVRQVKGGVKRFSGGVHLGGYVSKHGCRYHQYRDEPERQ